MSINLETIKNIHVVGIKGAGVIALVEILHGRGFSITGSDTDEKFFTDKILKQLGIKVKEGFSSSNIPDHCDLVLFSTAYSLDNNEELAAAEKRGIPMRSYPEMLAQLFNEKYGIAVCGTHGKTTTTAMLGVTLEGCGLDPTVVVGSKVVNWQGNSRVGESQLFAIEADEYQNKLALYRPKAVIFTSVDYDHPDFFPTPEDYCNTFRNFLATIPQFGILVACADSAEVLEVSRAAKCQVVTYGFSQGSDYQIVDVQMIEDGPRGLHGSRFVIQTKDGRENEYAIWVSGKHNVLNATAVIALIESMRMKHEDLSVGLERFRGTVRRFEQCGTYKNSVLIDDYAHHPEEIKVTLKAAREIYPQKNIVVVFHPHTFSRTAALIQEFSQSFEDANQVIILDIYGSAREAQGIISSQDLVNLINRYQHGKAEYVPTISGVVEFLKNKLGDNDVLITMGAGNVWEVIEKLKNL